jgi:hypothetical protein
MSIFAADVEIKKSTKHVEAVIWVFSGRGFDSPRLHFSRFSGKNRAVEQKNSRALEKTKKDQNSSHTKSVPLHCGLRRAQSSRLLLNCSTVLLQFRPPMAFMFEYLQVYQKAVDLADRIAAGGDFQNAVRPHQRN